MRFALFFLPAALLLSLAAAPAGPPPERAECVTHLTVLSVGVNAHALLEDREDLFAVEGQQVLRLFRDRAPAPPSARLLAGEGATREKVLDGLRWAAAEARAHPSGLTVVYLDCHGGFVPPARGAPEEFACLLADDLLWGRELRAAIDQIPGRVLLILDTCHSAAILDDWPSCRALVLAACGREQKARGWFLADRLRYAAADADYDQSGGVDTLELAWYLYAHDSYKQRVAVGSHRFRAEVLRAGGRP